MKNPRKALNNTVRTVARGLKNTQRDLEDLPVFIEPNMAPPQNLRSPEEESFRALLHDKLSRHKAPQALRKRIIETIKNMPD